MFIMRMSVKCQAFLTKKLVVGMCKMESFTLSISLLCQEKKTFLPFFVKMKKKFSTKIFDRRQNFSPLFCKTFFACFNATRGKRRRKKCEYVQDGCNSIKQIAFSFS